MLLITFVSILLVVSKAESDADKWIRIGQENAHRDLDLFNNIAAQLASGSSNYQQLDKQLSLLQGQINDSTANNRILIPQIVGVVTRVNDYLSGSPGWWAKSKLRALIWFVDGKRDNKSYYLLDGAQLWSDLRIKALETQAANPVINSLIKDLHTNQKATANLRDELDAMAQIFVQGIKSIHAMQDDIDGNLVALQKIAKELLLVSGQKDKFLSNSQELEDDTAKLVKKWAPADTARNDL